MLVLLVAAAVAVGLTRGGGGTTRPATARHSTSIISAKLPATGGFISLSVAGGRLVAIGGPNEFSPTGRCDSATVNPTTLRVSDRMEASCGDPALYHQRVMPLTFVAKRNDPRVGGPLMAIKIATVNPGAPDRYTIGPTVMTYPDSSDTRPTSLYGNGSLWIFDPAAHPVSLGIEGPTSGELVLVSTDTGTVLQRWIVPSLWRPLLAVDADGVWIAPSLYTGDPLHASRREQVLYQSLYLVTPGSRTVRRVRNLGPGGTRWMVASGHTVWLDVTIGSSPDEVARWSLRGAEAT